MVVIHVNAIKIKTKDLPALYTSLGLVLSSHFIFANHFLKVLRKSSILKFSIATIIVFPISQSL